MYNRVIYQRFYQVIRIKDWQIFLRALKLYYCLRVRERVGAREREEKRACEKNGTVIEKWYGLYRMVEWFDWTKGSGTR